jgi:hypothetical protein
MLVVDFEQFVGRARFESGELTGFAVGIAGLAVFPAGCGGRGGRAALLGLSLSVVEVEVGGCE